MNVHIFQPLSSLIRIWLRNFINFHVYHYMNILSDVLSNPTLVTFACHAPTPTTYPVCIMKDLKLFCLYFPNNTPTWPEHFIE